MPNRRIDHATIRMYGRGRKPQIASPLDAHELQAVGLVTVQWAHLEHSVLVHTYLIAEQIGETPRDDAANLSFAKRLQEFRRLGSSPKLPVGESRRYIKLCDRIANLESRRHKVVHALWTWDIGKPKKLTAVSFRPRTAFEVPVNLEKLNELATRISELLFDIDFPNGVDFSNIVPSRPRLAKRA